jgi:hypothetical protein
VDQAKVQLFCAKIGIAAKTFCSKNEQNEQSTQGILENLKFLARGATHFSQNLSGL